MVRNYKKTKPSYEEIQMEKALEAVRDPDNPLGIREAARKFNLNRTTLSKRKRGIVVKRRGRRPVFSVEEEKELADALKTLAKWGFAQSKKDVANVVQEYVKLNNLETPFKSGKPGRDWLSGFFSRTDLKVKKLEPLEICRRRATSDPFIIYGFYELLIATAEELNLISHPEKIYNLDESGFNHDPHHTEGIAGKGQKAHRVIQGCGKLNTSVMTCCAANGNFSVRLIV